MIKKISIILSLLLSVNITYAISISDIVNNTKNMFQQEKSIQKPDFSLVDINGNIHTKTSTDGQYLVVNFWATWCPPCRKEMPDFIEFYEKHKDKVLILGMDFENADKTMVTDFLDTFMVNYPIILFDKNNSAQFEKFGEIRGMPTTLVYDPEGNLIDFHEGEMNVKDLEKSIISKS